MAEISEQVTWYWKDLPGVVAGISRKSAGWMNADKIDLARGQIGKNNRDKFFASLGFDPAKSVAITGLRHTTNIVAANHTDAGQVVYGESGVDGLSTDQSGLVLASTMSDCLPLYFYDPVAKVAAIAHAGWRGVLNNIAEAVAKHLQESYLKVQPNNLYVLIGPGLRSCHFEVRSDVEAMFKDKYADFIEHRDNKIYIDLPGIVRYQLSQVGLPSDNVKDSGECNYELADNYFSFRRDHPVKPQSMIAFMTLSNG